MADKKQLYNEGLDLFGQSKFAEAIELLNQAVELDPQDGELHLAISMSYHRMKKLDEALEAAKKAVELNPREPLFHTNMSRIYVDKGMIQEAEDAMALSRQISG